MIRTKYKTKNFVNSILRYFLDYISCETIMTSSRTSNLTLNENIISIPFPIADQEVVRSSQAMVIHRSSLIDGGRATRMRLYGYFGTTNNVVGSYM